MGGQGSGCRELLQRAFRVENVEFENPAPALCRGYVFRDPSSIAFAHQIGDYRKSATAGDDFGHGFTETSGTADDQGGLAREFIRFHKFADLTHADLFGW